MFFLVGSVEFAGGVGVSVFGMFFFGDEEDELIETCEVVKFTGMEVPPGEFLG